MSIINKEFDKVVCVNLVNRKDKKEVIAEKFNNYNINVEWFEAVQYGFAEEIVKSLKPNINGFPRFNLKHPNEFGAALSHYTVIKTALEQGVEKLFVFEDDVLFRKDFNNKLEKSLSTLPKDWDMINLYSFMYNIMPENKRINANWITSFRGWSLLAYGINRKAMQRYIDNMDKKFQIADLTSFNMQEESDMNIYSAVPTLCIPNTEIGSNIRGTDMNYKTTNTVINTGYSNENYE